MIKGLKKVLLNLTNIKNALKKDIDRRFIELSLKWISNRANELLDSDLTYAPHTFGTNIREWDIIINNNVGRLENRYENSASVEFGIGPVGKEQPQLHAQESSWQYDIGNRLKINSENDGWNFYDQNGKFWYNFRGYKGKSFLYDALMEYNQKEMWKILYEQAFDEIVGSIKGVKRV